jgi:integrase
MPSRAFNTTWLNSLARKPPDARQDYTEPGRKGFMLRHWPGGDLSFVVRYQRDGKPRIMTIGTYPALSLDAAHDEHAEARRQLSRGLDPIDERDRTQAAQLRARAADDRKRRSIDAVTIRNVIAEFAWHHARKERKRPREAVRLLRVYLEAPLAGKAAQDITKRDLVQIIDQVVARGSGVMANRIRDLAAQVFAFAVERDLIPASPAAGLRKKPGGDEQSKDRSLNRDEIAAFWKSISAPSVAISAQVRLALKLILTTAQRPGEVMGARLHEFDIANRAWTIPASRAKNGVEHRVPLSDLAIDLISDLTQLAHGRPHLLPSVHKHLKPSAPISERALSRALRNNHKGGKLFGLDPFTPHDLRRSAATMMTQLGIARLHVGKLLNHSDKETTAIYDRHDYWPEKKQAATIWAHELRNIITSKTAKVVPIRARA